MARSRLVFRMLAVARISVHVVVLALFVNVGFCAEARAQFASSGTGPIAPNSEKYTMHGTVVNSVTGEPVAHALVRIFVQGQRAVLTDSSGGFQFDHLPKCTTTVDAEKPGFFSEPQISGWRQPQMFSVGPDASPVTVKLVQQGVLVGQVTSHEIGRAHV